MDLIKNNHIVFDDYLRGLVIRSTKEKSVKLLAIIGKDAPKRTKRNF